MIVLDTNVISEPLRQSPNPLIVEWIDAQVIETLYVTAITIAELRFGIAMMAAGKRRDGLLERIEAEVLPLFDERVLYFDMPAAQSYGTLMAKARAKGIAVGTADGYIAATVAANGMKIATRDTNPFEAVGISVLNPWDTAEHIDNN